MWHHECHQISCIKRKKITSTSTSASASTAIPATISRSIKCLTKLELLIVLCCYFISIIDVSSANTNYNLNPILIGVRSAIASTKHNYKSQSDSVEHYFNGGRISISNNAEAMAGVKTRARAGGANIANSRTIRSNRRRLFQQQPQTCCDESDDSDDSDDMSSILLASNTQVAERRETYTQVSTQTQTTISTNTPRGGGKAKKAIPLIPKHLNFWENMVCGAVSRSIAQTATHPANTMKTLLQSNRDTVSSTASRISIKSIAKVQNMKMLTRGAGAQFVLSIPHGAVNFAVLELVRRRINNMAMKSEWASKKKESSAAFGPAMDFVSSAIATVCCSVVSTPQMMIVDNIMAGTYPNLVQAVSGLSSEKGIAGFYTGWWPGLAGKIPSYALTWTLFQQLKQLQLQVCQREPKDWENSIMGCMASATTVCIMIPMDTIKTRLVTQMNYPDLVPYKGIIDAAVRISKEEGMGTFYRGLPPRLISVVPMIGIQFGVYEFMKKVMLSRHNDDDAAIAAGKTTGPFKKNLKNNSPVPTAGERQHTIESVIMEVAADDDQPFPAPVGDYRKNDSSNTPMKKKGAAFVR